MLPIPPLVIALLFAGPAGPAGVPVCYTSPGLDPCTAVVSAVRTERWAEASICLEICRAGFDGVKPPCRWTWLEGRIHEGAGRADDARKSYGSLVDCAQVPEPLRLLGLFRLALDAGDHERARKLGRALLDARPPRSMAGAVRLDLAEVLLSLGRADDAQGLLPGSRSGSTEERARVLDIERRVALLRGRRGDMETLTRQLLTDLPCAAQALALEADADVGSWSSEARMERARSLYRCWHYEKAAALLQACVDDPGCQRHHLEAHELLGEIRMNKLRDQPGLARGHFEALLRGKRKVAYATYMTGRSFMKQERYDDAILTFEEYLRRFPKGEHVERCRYYLGWLPFDHGRWQDALAPFDEFLAMHEGGSLYTYVLWFKGWSLYKLGRMKAALKIFERLGQYRKDIVGGKGRYWAAVVLHRLGRREEAQAGMRALIERYPLTWYGLLAWWRLSAWTGKEVPHPFLDQPPVAETVHPVNWEPRWLSGDLRTQFTRVGDLVRLGEIALARELWRPIAEPVTARVPPAARPGWDLSMSHALETPDDARALGRKRWRVRRELPGQATAARWQLEYPQAYWSLLVPEAARWGLSPFFVDGIMRQESRYRRGVVSWADAMGLVQLIPSTAARVGRLIGLEVPRFRVFEPAVNLRLGAGYLGLLFREFGGVYILTAAAYNSGAPAITGFMARENQGIDEAVEDIAYNEGRNYCRKVVGHLLVYLTLHAPIEERKALLPHLIPDKVPRTFPGVIDF
ncbi:MAG: tetratricopeptide repeat protein [Pseudomonadota bacterium]